MTGDTVHLWVLTWGHEGFRAYLRKPLSGGNFGVMCKGRIGEGENPVDVAYRIAVRQLSERVVREDLLMLPGREEGVYVFMLQRKFEHYNTGNVKGEITSVEVSQLWDYIIAGKEGYNVNLDELSMVINFFRNGDVVFDRDMKVDVAVIDQCMIANEFSMKNKKQLEHSSICGCFGCLKIFDPSEITEYIPGEDTAVCPYCGTDAILGDASGYQITEEFIKEMNEAHFGEIMKKAE